MKMLCHIQAERTQSVLCALIRESCSMEIASADVQFAYQLHLIRGELQPILVSFHFFSLRTKVVKSHSPRKIPLYHGDKIFINDHLNKTNSDLVRKARLMVKK